MTEPLLRVDAIETFYGPIQAIRGVSLEVAPHQIVTVLGANGAGKTTVLRTVSGILDPEGGKVWIGWRYRLGFGRRRGLRQRWRFRPW